jgi:hypothetical protein
VRALTDVVLGTSVTRHHVPYILLSLSLPTPLSNDHFHHLLATGHNTNYNVQTNHPHRPGFLRPTHNIRRARSSAERKGLPGLGSPVTKHNEANAHCTCDDAGRRRCNQTYSRSTHQPRPRGSRRSTLLRWCTSDTGLSRRPGKEDCVLDGYCAKDG